MPAASRGAVARRFPVSSDSSGRSATPRPSSSSAKWLRWTTDSASTRRWIVDPLDGTTNFLHGLPHWAVSIALEHKGEIVAAVVFDPAKDELYTAERGDGAFVNDQRLLDVRDSEYAVGGVAIFVVGQGEQVAAQFDNFRASRP